MVQTITRYRCEICRTSYDSRKDAAHCEARGRIRPTGKSYDGVIYGDAGDPKSFYAGITFATHGIDKLLAEQPDRWRYAHALPLTLYACRDNGAGDSTNGEHCGGGSWSGGRSPLRGEAAPDPSHPTFQRMVNALQREGITPRVWNGKRIVSLPTYLRSKTAKEKRARWYARRDSGRGHVRQQGR